VPSLVAAILGPILLVALLLAPEASAPPTLPRGEIVPRVVCEADSEETYAAYLPTSYDPGRPSPILYLLDARRRGTIAAEAFRAAAESSGWILASSNNSESDGPFLPNIRAMRAMWDDTRARFAIDPRRVYATGFSGGARAACLLAQTAAKGQIAGVIGCGAGFPDNAPPARGLPFVYFGAIGNADFNYREMRQLDTTLASLGVAHRLAVFDGPHGWPPPEVCGRAVEWMELAAMRNGSRPRDESLVARWLALALREAAALETAERKGEALARYREIAEDFEGLADVSAVRATRDRLEKEEEPRRQIEIQARLEREEDATLADLRGRLFKDLRSEEPVPAQRVALDLRLSALRRNAESAGSEAERLSATRIRTALFVQTSFYLAREYLERRDDRRAALCAAVAAEVYPDRAGTVWYNFACLQARLGDAKAALATLRTAVEKGFHDAEQLERDPDLEKVRAEGGYRKILDELRSRAGRP
jgi:predicted esterase